MTKPTIYFKALYENNTHYVLPASPEAEALFELLRRKHLAQSELAILARMGVQIFVAGDNKELGKELKRRGEVFSKDEKGVIRYEN